MTPVRRITIIGPERPQTGHLALRLESKGFQVAVLTRLPTAMGTVYSDPPDIVIVDLATPSPDISAIVRQLKEDCYFNAIPVIGLMDGITDDFDWEASPLDDFFCQPINYPELFSRVNLSLRRIRRVFDNNPLTRLPGNTSIQQEIERVLGWPMAVCYIDVNHFKPYNDMYGFSRGDEVLRMIGRIMFNAVKESGGGFTGHIGGDDFVFIVPLERAENVCRTIIANFSAIVADLFDETDKERGCYVSVNRKGQEETFPLLGISIAVVPTNTSQMKHAGKVVEVATELKKLAKKSEKSCYVIDQRR